MIKWLSIVIMIIMIITTIIIIIKIRFTIDPNIIRPTPRLRAVV